MPSLAVSSSGSKSPPIIVKESQTCGRASTVIYILFQFFDVDACRLTRTRAAYRLFIDIAVTVDVEVGPLSAFLEVMWIKPRFLELFDLPRAQFLVLGGCLTKPLIGNLLIVLVACFELHAKHGSHVGDSSQLIRGDFHAHMTIRAFLNKGKAYRNPLAAFGRRLEVVRSCPLDKRTQRIRRRTQAAEQILEVS